MRQARPILGLFKVIVAAVMVATLAGCLTQTRTQGYDIPEDALQQIRPGVSQDFVRIVLGSPQTTNNFNNQESWYYVETKVDRTSFGTQSVKERTVLAVYYGNDNRVADKAVYTLKDGRVFELVPRTTPGFSNDKSFIESLLGSLPIIGN